FAGLILSNYSDASYNALQFDIQRRFHRGLQFQANYTFGKALSDSNGTVSDRFEAIRDPRNGKIDRSRPGFDVTHAIKANGVYDLPFGRNQQGLVRALASGWSVSSITSWQSG